MFLRMVCCTLLLSLTVAIPAHAQTIATVNDTYHITCNDVQERRLYAALTNHFGDSIKALLTSEETRQRFQKMMIAANPRSQEDAQQAAERIKKQIITEAKNRILNEAGGLTNEQILDALIEDYLKIQAAQSLQITFSDQEVEAQMMKRMEKGDKASLAPYFQQFKDNGVSRETVLQVYRVQLVWREVIRLRYPARLLLLLDQTQDGRYAEWERHSKAYYETLKQAAHINNEMSVSSCGFNVPAPQ